MGQLDAIAVRTPLPALSLPSQLLLTPVQHRMIGRAARAPTFLHVRIGLHWNAWSGLV
jgi:hypothetical protein